MSIYIRGKIYKCEVNKPIDIHIPEYNILISDTILGEGVSIWSNVNIYGAKIGKGAKIGAFVEIRKDVVQIPYVDPSNETIYHQYTIRTSNRDELRQYLTKKGIGTGIHYPMPFYFQKAFKYLSYKEGAFPEAEKASKEVLSLPIHQDLTDEEIAYVITTIRQFFKK